MEVKETKLVEVSKEVTVSIECDCCKTKHFGNTLPTSWHSFTHGHEDWGNDSFESIETFHCCSVHCYSRLLSISVEYMKANDNTKTCKIDGMSYVFAKRLTEILR